MLKPIDRTTEEVLIPQIDSDEMSAHLDFFEGLKRHSGTDDEWRASEYIVEKLEEYDVEGEILEHEALISEPLDASISITAPTRHDIEESITMSFSKATPPEGVHGEVVRIEDVDEYSEDPLDGKIVFTTGLPGPEMALAAEKAGAEALIVESVTENQLHEMTVSPIWGTPSTDDANQLPDLPVAEITQEDAGWLKNQCRQGPVEASVTTEVTTQIATLPCPVGFISGTGSERYMIVGNHVDSWYEGLTDNATAMAATLELARIFSDSPPDRGIVFGFWSAHSFGRFAGSAWYADSHWSDLRENGVAYLHLDLNGLKGADRLWYQHMAELEEEQLDVLDSVSELPLETSEKETDVPMWEGSDRPGRAADQSFWGSGLSSIFCGIRLPAGTSEGGPIGGGWWWHTPEDTRDKVDIDILRQETEFYVALASRMCNSPVLPHDFTKTIEDFESTLQEIESEAAEEVQFEEEYQALDQTKSAIQTSYEIIDTQAESDRNVAGAAENLQVSLGNALIPALYMGQPDYGHEPAYSHNLLPYLRVAEKTPNLTGRARQFAETKIRRGKSKLRHRVRKAENLAKSFNTEYRE